MIFNYFNHSSVPPPFNILYRFIQLISSLFKPCCNKNVTAETNRRKTVIYNFKIQLNNSYTYI